MSVYRISTLCIVIHISVFEILQETSLLAHYFRHITMTDKGIIGAKYTKTSKG